MTRSSRFRSSMWFWNISQFFLLIFWIPGMADLFSDSCKQWQQEFFTFPTYNCSIPRNSTITIPMMLNNWTYLDWRANSTRKQVIVLTVHNGALRPFRSEFKDYALSNGYLSLKNLKEDQQGEYDVREKDTIKARIYVCILPDQESKKILAVSAAAMLPVPYLLLCCVLLMVFRREL